MKTPTEILWLISQEQLCNVASLPQYWPLHFSSIFTSTPFHCLLFEFEFCYLYYVLSYFLAFLKHLFSYNLYFSAAQGISSGCSSPFLVGAEGG